MEKQNKIAVSYNKEETIYGLSIPIEYEETELMDNIEKIKFTYIKYKGKRRFNENGINVEKFFIEFINMSKELLKELSNTINEKIDELNGTKSIYEALNFIVNLFSKHKFFDREMKKFNGDLGEALFMLECKNKLNIDMSKYYRGKNNLYDFHINELNKNIEIKSCHKANAKIMINNRQIEESDSKDFYAVEYQFVEGMTDILEIYEMIGFENNLIKEKYDNWKHKLSLQEGIAILERQTVDLQKINCYQIDPDSIPHLAMTNDKCVDKVEITLNVSTSRSNGISGIKKFFEN